MTQQTHILKKLPTEGWAIALLSLIGIGISWTQSHQFYSLRFGNQAFKSFCDVSATTQCTVVQLSPYAEFFAGIPVSSVAASWLCALLLLSLLPLWTGKPGGSLWSRILLGMTGVSVVTSLFYLVIMLKVLGVKCLLCLTIDAINLASFGLALKLWWKQQGSKHHTGGHSVRFSQLSTIGALSLLIGVGGAKLLSPATLPEERLATIVDSVLESNALPMEVPESAASIGPKDARITVVKFSDFQCPACKMAALNLHPLFGRYAGSVRFVFRNFPLDSTCNSKAGALHPGSCDAARIALCSVHNGQFRDVYEKFFSQQGQLKSASAFLKAAVELGANEETLKSCADSDATRALLAQDLRDGETLNIRSTPTFFINGRRFEGALPTEAWIRILDRLLQN